MELELRRFREGASERWDEYNDFRLLSGNDDTSAWFAAQYSFLANLNKRAIYNCMAFAVLNYTARDLFDESTHQVLLRQQLQKTEQRGL